MTTVVVTMAGRSQRFRDAGYDAPKFTIEVHGRTLFEWSLRSLWSWLTLDDVHLILVSRREDAAQGFVRRRCEAFGIASWSLVELDHTTDGQATSVLAALPQVVDLDAALLIYNIDTHVDPAVLSADRVRGDGWLPCFPGRGAAWSFARADQDGRVLEVREKQRISDDATIGLYWFRSFRLYENLYAQASQAGRGLHAGERYIAPLYDDLVRRGGTVYLERLPYEAVVPLGTPAEVEAFRVRAAIGGSAR
ncbi:MAG: NTP transferase domain-containing protein [Actinomycetota bacterium]|nr:NTP transferase domain-containing protein [Actinomycetota bacterium]